MADRQSRRFDPPPSFYFLAFAFLAVLAAALWLREHTWIAYYVLVWKHAELQMLHPFTDYYLPLDRQVVTYPAQQMSLAQIWRLFSRVGSSVNLLTAGVVAFLAVIAYFRAPSARFRTVLDAAGVFRAQGRPFRCARAYLDREQLLVEPRAGTPRPNDFALHLPEWIERYAWDQKRGFREDLARRALANQLGPVWVGPAAAQPQARVLFAAFALHAARERTAATDLLGDFAEGLSRGSELAPLPVPESVLATADQVILDTTITDPCVKLAAKHAFQTTALMAVLEAARERAGVLAPAQFNGIKLIDRALWYPLHSLGMSNPYAEALGANNHYAAEQLLGQPIHVPSVDDAMQTVRTGISDVRKVTTPKG